MTVAGAILHGENHEKCTVHDTLVIHVSGSDYGQRLDAFACLRQQVDKRQRSFNIARQQLLAA